MNVAVISDLHLGNGGASDMFGHDDAEFLAFLSYLERNFERVVLLGDIYETLTCASPFAQAEEFGRCRVAHAEISKRFDGPQYTYIHGNHDLVGANMVGAADQMRLNVDGVQLLFTHGHGFDFVERYARWVSVAGVWLGGWLCRMGLGPIMKAFDRLDHWQRGAHDDPRKCKFQQWAVDLARRQKADVIVTGHTHQGVVAEHGSHLFLNSGSCAEGEYSFLSIDTKSGQYAMNHSW
jgi:UDP-2,3-diacylglucosamine pyrophosphatase LpxH